MKGLWHEMEVPKETTKILERVAEDGPFHQLKHHYTLVPWSVWPAEWRTQARRFTSPRIPRGQFAQLNSCITSLLYMDIVFEID